MAIPLRKIVHRTSGLLGRPERAVYDIATHIEVLCPVEKTETPPAIYNPEDLQRVTEIAQGTSKESELRRLRGGSVEWPATRAFHMKNVVLEDGSFYSSGWRARVSERPKRWCGGRPVELDQASLATTYCASVSFAHWLTDDLTMLLEAEKAGTPVTVAREAYIDEPYYADALSAYATALTRARFKKFVYFEDTGENSLKRHRYEELRSRLRKKHPTEGSRRVFLHRGMGATRKLVNEEAVDELLTRDGFTVINPGVQTAHEIAQTCAGATIVIGVEGSQLAHAFMGMRQGGTIVALVPPYRFINHFKDQADCIGLRYGMIVGTATKDGFCIKLEELSRLLDRVDRETC